MNDLDQYFIFQLRKFILNLLFFPKKLSLETRLDNLCNTINFFHQYNMNTK